LAWAISLWNDLIELGPISATMSFGPIPSMATACDGAD
jgi:hypothetical protein